MNYYNGCLTIKNCFRFYKTVLNILKHKYLRLFKVYLINFRKCQIVLCSHKMLTV